MPQLQFGSEVSGQTDSHTDPAWQFSVVRLEQRGTQISPLVLTQHDDVTQAMFGPQSVSLAQAEQKTSLLQLSQQTKLPSMSVAQTQQPLLLGLIHCTAGWQPSPPWTQMFCGADVVVVLVVVVDVVVLVVVVVGVAHRLVVGSQNPLQQMVFEVQCFPLGVQGLAKAMPMRDRPRAPPTVAAIALRA